MLSTVKRRGKSTVWVDLFFSILNDIEVENNAIDIILNMYNNSKLHEYSKGNQELCNGGPKKVNEKEMKTNII